MIAHIATRHWSALALAAVIAAVFGVAGASADSTSPSSPSPTASPTLVVIKDFAFKPATLTIKPGTTVQWRNDDGVPHTATASGGAFDSHNLDRGATYTFTFTKPGTYAYVCSYHPSMTATITVSGDQ